MVKVEYKNRLFTDYYFIEWLSKRSDLMTILSNLIHIKASSKQHPREHNVILQNDLDRANKDKILSEGKIKACFKRKEIPDFLTDEKNEISRNIRFAISLTSEKPHGCIIFTSPEMREEYLKNTSLENVKTVIIREGENGLGIIRRYFRQFQHKREVSR